ncbi:putative 2-methylcitrate dehydratase [Xylaria telfairii]|nr:putative 2-methylcitrate dehydratase [Xylaria telfairii]
MSTESWDPVLVMINDFVYSKKHYSDYPIETLTLARLALKDALCCSIESISKSVVCRSLLGPVIPGTIVPNGVKIPGTSHQVDPVKGAFDLGTAIRFLDHDDVLGGLEWGHPADNLGALLVISDYLCRTRQSAVTIGTLLEALIKAYEIQGVMLIRNAFNARGLDHVVLVKTASAAVVSWLMGLDKKQGLAVLSHVFMDNVPLRVYRHGSNTIPRKGWAAGDACSRAIQLNMLVQAGQPGAPSVLTAPKWGFYDSVWGGKPFEFPINPHDWAMKNVFFKLMPVEGHSISAIEACLAHHGHLMATYGLSAYKHIGKVKVRTSSAANMLINKEGPLRNPADRDHCMQYILAVTLVKGAAPVAEDFFDDSLFQTTDLVEVLRKKITVEESNEFTKRYYDLNIKSLPCAVSIDMDDGTSTGEKLVEFPIGHTKNPKTIPALRSKFWENMSLMYPDHRVGEIESIVQNHTDTPVSHLMDLMFCPVATTKL